MIFAKYYVCLPLVSGCLGTQSKESHFGNLSSQGEATPEIAVKPNRTKLLTPHLPNITYPHHPVFLRERTIYLSAADFLIFCSYQSKFSEWHARRVLSQCGSVTGLYLNLGGGTTKGKFYNPWIQKHNIGKIPSEPAIYSFQQTKNTTFSRYHHYTFLKRSTKRNETIEL